MSPTFRQVDRETVFLLPPPMDDWLPEGHLARFFVGMVARFDLTATKAASFEDPWLCVASLLWFN